MCVFDYLVTKDLDLGVGSMEGLVAAVVVAVRVNLDHQRQTLYPLLRRKVCTQTVYRDEDLSNKKHTVSENNQLALVYLII